MPSTPNASLLYTWHCQKDQTWGLIVPVVLDTQDESERSRAAETITAYCATQHLQLTNIVFFTAATPSVVKGKRHNVAKRTQWSVSDVMTIVHDYAHLLQMTGGGRIIVVQTIAEDSVDDWERARILKNLLLPRRITVSELVYGTLSLSSDDDEWSLWRDVPNHDSLFQFVFLELCAMMKLAIQVQEEEVVKRLQQITSSKCVFFTFLFRRCNADDFDMFRYPLLRNCAGLHANLHRFSRVFWQAA